MTRQQRPVYGLTLVELLVVIAIIGILLSILLPTVSSARRSARGVVCSSNLKQLGNGWHIYAELNEDTIVAGRPAKFSSSSNIYWVGNGYQYRPRWYIQMGASAGFYAYDKPSTDPADDNSKTIDNKVFLCPERAQWINNRNYAYGYNYQFLGNSRFFAGSEQTGYIHFPVKRYQLPRLNATIIAADALGTSATYKPAARTPYRPDGNAQLRAWGNHGWSLDPPRLTAGGDFCDNNHRGEARSGPDPRHQKQANFLYGDSHVEKQDPEDLGYRRKADGAYPMPGEPDNDLRSHNRFFSGNGEDQGPPGCRPKRH